MLVHPKPDPDPNPGPGLYDQKVFFIWKESKKGEASCPPQLTKTWNPYKFFVMGGYFCPLGYSPYKVWIRIFIMSD
jgi:hypothetical protein